MSAAIDLISPIRSFVSFRTSSESPSRWTREAFLKILSAMSEIRSASLTQWSISGSACA